MPSLTASRVDKGPAEPLQATPRLKLPAWLKEGVLGWQLGKCAGCQTPLDNQDVEFDHIIPLELGGSNKLENVQALCVPCHRDKTREDMRRIRKASRIRRREAGEEPPKRKIKSRGFWKDPLR